MNIQKYLFLFHIRLQFLRQFPQQVNLQAIPIISDAEGQGRRRGTGCHAKRFPRRLRRDVRIGLHLGKTVCKPEILQLLHGTVGLHTLLDGGHGLGKGGVFPAEGEPGGELLLSEEGDFDSVLPLDDRVEHHLVDDHYVGPVIRQSLQEVAFCIEAKQLDVFTGGEVHLIAASRSDGYAKPGQILLAVQHNFVLFMAGAGNQRQGAEYQ